MTTYFIEPGDWESATGECLPSGSNGIAVVPLNEVKNRISKLESALKTIIENQKMMGGGLAQWSTTRLIAENALKQEEACEK
jgi:hypothetical protein